MPSTSLRELEVGRSRSLRAGRPGERLGVHRLRIWSTRSRALYLNGLPNSFAKHGNLSMTVASAPLRHLTRVRAFLCGAPRTIAVSDVSWIDHPRGAQRGRRGSAKPSYQQRPRILLVGPMPPTKGGITTFMLNLMGSYLNEQFEFVPYTTTRPPNAMSSTIGDTEPCSEAGPSAYSRESS